MSNDERMMAVVVAAVAGGPRLFEKLTGTEALYAVDRCLKRMKRGIDSFRGHIVRTTRDEIVATFDNCDDACQAAIAMQRRIGDLPPVAGIKLAVRAGVHHGPVFNEDSELVGLGVSVAEGLASLATSGQVLASNEAHELLSSHLKALAHDLPNVWLQSLADEQTVFEIHWLEQRNEMPKAAIESTVHSREKNPRLRVRYRDTTIVLDGLQASLVIGRDTHCEITVRDRRVSRQHARIERVGEYFVLSDLSTNGTLVTLTGENELLLKREEFILRGSGVIAFAGSANHAATDTVEFEHL